MVMVAVLATEVIGESPCEYVALDVINLKSSLKPASECY